MKIFFLLLSLDMIFFVIAFQTCKTNKPDKETNPKYFIVRFTEPLDSISALNKQNYFIRGRFKDTVAIKEVRFLKSIQGNIKPFPKNSIVVLIPLVPIYDLKYYTIEVKNIKDKAGNILNPNPTKIYVK